MVSFSSFYDPTSSNNGFSPPTPPGVLPNNSPSVSTPSTMPPPGNLGGRGNSPIAPPTVSPNATSPASLPSTPGITPGGSPTPSLTPPSIPTAGPVTPNRPSTVLPPPSTVQPPAVNGPPTGGGSPVIPFTPPGNLPNPNTPKPLPLPNPNGNGQGSLPLPNTENNNFEMPARPTNLVPASTVKQDNTGPIKQDTYIPPDEKSGDADEKADGNNFDGTDLETAREEAKKDFDEQSPTDLNIPTGVPESDLKDVQDIAKDSTENKAENADGVVTEDQKEKRDKADTENAKKEDQQGKQDQNELKCPKGLDENGDAKDGLDEVVNEMEENTDNPSEDPTLSVNSNTDKNDDSASNQNQPEEFTIEEEYNWFEPKNNLFNKLLPNGLGIQKGYKRRDENNPFDPNMEAEHNLFTSEQSNDFFWNDGDIAMGKTSWAFNVNASHGRLNTQNISHTFTPSSALGDSSANGYNINTTSSSSSEDFVNIKAEYIHKSMMENGDTHAIKIAGQVTPGMSDSDFQKIDNYNDQRNFQNSFTLEYRRSFVDGNILTMPVEGVLGLGSKLGEMAGGLLGR